MKDEEYQDVLNRCVTHSARIKFLIPLFLKNVNESMEVIAWAEGVLRMNGQDEPADKTHKVAEQLQESVLDMGEMLDLTRLDVTELIEHHVSSLAKIIEDWTNEREEK